ncbi:MAG TPA: hypothetical protein VLX85_12960 [Stellaceae bacterium]|nr:hypothetical protein [Stellaceae bacterium]
MLKTAILTAAAFALATGAVTPAWAAKPIGSCYDFAWESQDQKDCLANPDMLKHMSHHKGMKHMKYMTHGKHMKGMEHMEHMEHMDTKKS